MTENILICCLTVLGSLIVAFYAQYKTTKLKFFEIFYNNKISAYNSLFHSLSTIQVRGIADTQIHIQLLEAIYQVSLYSSPEATEAAAKLATIVEYIDWKNFSQNDIDMLSQTFGESLSVFKEDIERCKRFRF